MSGKRSLNPSDAWRALTEQVLSGKAHPPVKPQRMPLRSIKLRPEVFQQRKPAKHASEAHIRALTKSAQSSAETMLDPITVWWDGKHWACIDGHHRIAAYLKANKSSDVPVQVFEGTPDEALMYSARSNTRDKLVMSRSEKMNAAWRLVVLSGGLSKAQLAEATGASPRQVAIMRSTKQALQRANADAPWDALPAADLATISWDAARRLAAGENALTWDDDEEARRVQAMAQHLRKALGATAERQVEVFAKAVELYSPMLAQGLAEYFRGAEDEAEEELESEF